MKLTLPLLALLATLGQTAHATTLVGGSLLEPITYTVEDVDPTDGIPALAEDAGDAYAPYAELMTYGSAGFGYAGQTLSDKERYLRASTVPSYSFLVGLYGGGDMGGFNLFSSFNSAQISYGQMYAQRNIKVTPNTRVRFKTKLTLQGGVIPDGPAIADQAKLRLSSTLTTYINGIAQQSKYYEKTVTQTSGNVLLKQDVEMEVLNNSDQSVTIALYYDLINDGSDAE